MLSTWDAACVLYIEKMVQTVVVTFSVNFNQVSMSSTKHPKSQKSKYVVLENV